VAKGKQSFPLASPKYCFKSRIISISQLKTGLLPPLKEGGLELIISRSESTISYCWPGERKARLLLPPTSLSWWVGKGLSPCLLLWFWLPRREKKPVMASSHHSVMKPALSWPPTPSWKLGGVKERSFCFFLDNPISKNLYSNTGLLDIRPCKGSISME
jgi:hypothetical protein